MSNDPSDNSDEIYSRFEEAAVEDVWDDLTDADLAYKHIPDTYDLTKLVAKIAGFRGLENKYMGMLDTPYQTRLSERNSDRQCFIDELYKEIESLYEFVITKNAQAAYEARDYDE